MKSAVRIGSEKTMTNAQHTRGVQLCVDVCEVTSSQLQHYNMFFFLGCQNCSHNSDLGM